MNRFEIITSETIVDLISAASFQVVYIAPAMDMQVARALVQFAERRNNKQISVILDCSPNVYREGYGDIAALDMLQQQHIQVHDVRGLRIGILIIDGVWRMYAPLSKLQPVNRIDELKNAITGAVLYQLFSTESSQFNLFDSTIEETASAVEVAIDPYALHDTKIDRLKDELTRQPLPDFSLQQQLLQYRRLIQFVEITFNGGRLEKTTIKIPSQLLNIAKEKGFEEKIKASYQLFDKTFSIHTKPMAEKVEQLRVKYVHHIPRYGNVILVQEKENFLRDFHTIKQEIEAYTLQLQREVSKQIQTTKQELINNFTPIVQMDPPLELLHSATAEEQEIRGYIDLLLSDEIPAAEEVVKRIELHSTFKDLTEETLKDEQFYKQMEKAFKDQAIQWPHHRQQQGEISFF